jgi:hypothetical protein
MASPGRHPGRVLNPISYEKPVLILSMGVPKVKPAPGAGFSESHICFEFQFRKNNSGNGTIQTSIFTAHTSFYFQACCLFYLAFRACQAPTNRSASNNFIVIINKK